MLIYNAFLFIFVAVVVVTVVVMVCGISYTCTYLGLYLLLVYSKEIIV